MMSELRWILLLAGLALLAGIYLWGTRASRRSAATQLSRATRAEPTTPAAPPAPEAARREPQVRLDDATDSVADDVAAVRPASDPARAVRAGVRREPTLGQRLTAPVTRRIEPEPMVSSMEAAPQTAELSSEPAHGPAVAPERDRRQPPDVQDEEAAARAPADESETAVAQKADRIIAIRVTAPSPSRFEGSLLKEAIAAEGFEFGRYEIFHRLDPSGRPVVSLASLREPGTFDPATMAGAAYAGIALFSVLPGPLAAQHAFEELVSHGRALAGRLGGVLQDERGAPLTAQRIARIRDDMLAFDQDRAARTGH
jgi:cell division protein ZipA